MSTRVIESIRRPVDDTLDYAILSALIAVSTAVIILTTAVLTTPQAVFATATITFVIAFYVTPRVVAWWTDTPLQSLVRTQ